ncbi:hypothetical protein ABZX66_00555 [Micromonospora aurantiaca]|uniref:hypothetical protein n=1 Tax=Micromonospora aurantiaca (nom. illeg.) TaxID=47850 RepID=UPI0033AB9CE6
MTEARPFQPLRDRLAGKPLDTTLHDGVPEWLDQPLRTWLNKSTSQRLAQRVLLRLRVAYEARYPDSHKVQLVSNPALDLLTVIDAVLQLHPAWSMTDEDQLWNEHRMTRDDVIGSFRALDALLKEGGSLYRCDFDQHCLVRRVDDTTQAAVDAAVKGTSASAADHLRTAWAAAYGLNPDPDKVFNEAIRAVEEVACPLVEQKRAEAGSATLGTVIGVLSKNAPHKWELVLPGKDGQPSGVEPIVSMMEALWQAQCSRHGGAPKSRRQSQDEAEAAVHLAVLLVQWLSTGVLRKKP